MPLAIPERLVRTYTIDERTALAARAKATAQRARELVAQNGGAVQGDMFLSPALQAHLGNLGEAVTSIAASFNELADALRSADDELRELRSEHKGLADRVHVLLQRQGRR